MHACSHHVTYHARMQASGRTACGSAAARRAKICHRVQQCPLQAGGKGRVEGAKDGEGSPMAKEGTVSDNKGA